MTQFNESTSKDLRTLKANVKVKLPNEPSDQEICDIVNAFFPGDRTGLQLVTKVEFEILKNTTLGVVSTPKLRTILFKMTFLCKGNSFYF